MLSPELQFLLVAAAIYLWECCVWVPLRGFLLRRIKSTVWSAIDPRSVLVMRDRGLVIGLPIIADTGLAVCQSPPLVEGSDGKVWLDDGRGQWREAGPDRAVKQEGNRLYIGKSSVPLVSPSSSTRFFNYFDKKMTMSDVIKTEWTAALSPSRAAREWRRWRLATNGLRLLCPLLTIGFFAGMPAVYFLVSKVSALFFALWLFSIMLMIACHLWWMGSRVYRGAKSTLRMDAILCLLVPFHAMRAAQHAAVHALSQCHPAALLIGMGKLDHPCLASFARSILFPRPHIPGDLAFTHTVMPGFRSALAPSGRKPEDYVQAPEKHRDPEATLYCPRCHALFDNTATSCADCNGLDLKPR